MRINEITKKSLKNADNNELYSLRLRSIQLWGKSFKDDDSQLKCHQYHNLGDLNKMEFLDRYKMLIEQMNKRGLTRSTHDIDVALFKKSMLRVDASTLDDVIIVKDYISISGSFVKTPNEANDIDLIIKESDNNRDEEIEKKLTKLIQGQVKKDCHFVYNKAGAQSDYIPLFDLILRSKDETKKVEVKESHKKIEATPKLKRIDKAKYKRTECMECSAPPTVEVLWAEGMAHAWFCEKHFKEWATKGDGKGEVNSVKAIQDGEANMKFSDNKSPNIEDEYDFLKIHKQTDKDIILMEYGKLKEKGLSENEIIEEIAKILLPIGFDIEYWKKKIREVLKMVGQIKKEEGNIDYKVGDSGKAILQLHIMGIDEEKIAALKKVSSEAVKSKSNPTKLKMLLKGAIGEQGCHVDIRFVRKGDDYFEGGEIMVGNLTGLTKLNELEREKKLRFGWKVPRKEAPTAETIRGPVDWMKVGDRKIDIFEPGVAGATTNKYGAMLILDRFNFEMILADKHAKKIKVSGGKIVPDGILLMSYVPVGEGERVWMVSWFEEKLKMRFLKIDKKEYIVGGIVYPANEVDTQDDQASGREIWKALKKYMIKKRTIKIMHKGKSRNIPIIEVYQAYEDTHKGGNDEDHLIRKGDWYMSIYLGDEKEIWDEVESGKLTGFSMGGSARKY